MRKEQTTIMEYALIFAVAFGLLCFGLFIRIHVWYMAIADMFKRKEV